MAKLTILCSLNCLDNVKNNLISHYEIKISYDLSYLVFIFKFRRKVYSFCLVEQQPEDISIPLKLILFLIPVHLFFSH